jgi:tripartite-type tricarboxylate transporter receptor subunit TctC
MTVSRRRLLHLAVSTATLSAITSVVRAQTYPTRPVRLIEGFGAGGTPDIVSRFIGQWLSDRLGHQFVTENRTGAGSTIAADIALHASPDGYTLLVVTGANAVNSTLYERLSYNFVRDTVPVAGISRVPLVMEVNPITPVETVPEFIAYARANPGKINMASAGIGSVPHVAGELFKMMTGISMAHVPYRGNGAAIADLLGGQVQVYFDTLPSSIGYIRAGKLRPLAVTAAKRLEALPDIPTVGEFVPGYEASGWVGVGAPVGIPRDIVDRLNKEINAGLADSKMKAKLADLGAVPMPMTPADFGKFIADESDKWAKTVRFSGAKVE